MTRKEAFLGAKDIALKLHGDSSGKACLHVFYSTKYCQTVFLLDNRVVMNNEADQVDQLSDFCVQAIYWGAKKLRSRAKLVKNLVEINDRYFEKFGEKLTTAYINHLHAEALAAHQMIFWQCLVKGMSFEAIAEQAA